MQILGIAPVPEKRAFKPAIADDLKDPNRKLVILRLYDRIKALTMSKVLNNKVRCNFVERVTLGTALISDMLSGPVDPTTISTFFIETAMDTRLDKCGNNRKPFYGSDNLPVTLAELIKALDEKDAMSRFTVMF